MTDLDQKSNQYGAEADLSRARQRKLKRDRQLGIAPQPTSEPHKRSSSRRRASSTKGPSLRERIAATHINVPTPSMQAIQGKLSSRIGRLSRQFSDIQNNRNSSTQKDNASRRNSAHRAKGARGEYHVESTSHTETQRKTKSDRQSLPYKNKRLYDARSEVAPPVMVRGGMGGMAFGRSASSRMSKRKTPKRRFDVPLKVPGAEVRLPSIPMFHLGWRAISLLMVLMAIASLFLIWKAPVFQLNSVEAEGIKRLTVSDLNTVVGTVGSSIFTIDPKSIQASLTQAFPELSKISVKVGLPASMKVVVTERVPVIAWLQDGSEVWVDAEGVSFPPRGEPENPLVKVEGHGTPPGVTSESQMNVVQSVAAVISGSMVSPLPKVRLDPQLVSSILALGAKMPADTVLVYDSEHGLGWNDPKGWEVYFGAEDQDLEMKLNVYQTLVDRLDSEGIQPQLISVEYVHAPYYRMER